VPGLLILGAFSVRFAAGIPNGQLSEKSAYSAAVALAK